MKLFKKLSLRTKLLGLSLLTLAILAFGSWLSLNRIGAAYEIKTMGNFESYAENISKSIAAQFYERYGDVQAFAVNDAVKSMNGKHMVQALDSYVGLYGIYDLILVVDAKGGFIASNSKDASGAVVNTEALKSFDYSNEPWFKKIMSGQSTDDKTVNLSGTFVEDFMADPLMKLGLGEARLGSSFSAAIKNEKGETVGVITNRAGQRWFKADIDNILEEMKQTGLDDSEVYVLNGEGLTIQYGSVETDHPDYVLKRNFLKEGFQAAKLAADGQHGSIIDYNGEDKHNEVIGFYKLGGPKWISSMGWTVLVVSAEHAALKAVHTVRTEFMVMMLIACTIALTMSVWFSIVLSKSLNAVTNVLHKNSVEVTDASAKIAEQSVQLSESSTEQAAALQETMSAVDEISAMVEKNAEAANRSKDVSSQSKDAAERGKNIVDQMREAISDIDATNNDIASQMEQSNHQLSEITKLISDIGQKTKVINEIVFQTKLLSFNASVEAARAGEYGKGFSVVAEEVGNLAQMSGNAAKEISSLLDESIRKVESIVQESKNRVEKMIRSSKEKVDVGSKTVHDCNEALEEILSNVANVDSLVSEIAVASTEQAAGIKEISKAVGQMEQVTQQNSAAAQSSSSSAEQLKTQSHVLKEIVQDLMRHVHGQSEAVREVDSESSMKTIPFERKSKSKVSVSKVASSAGSEKAAPVVQKASGADFVPSSDDPGFQE